MIGSMQPPYGMSEYSCSRCTVRALVADAASGSPMHQCAGVAGMTVPLVPAGARSDVRMFAREDYVGTEDVQRDAEGHVWAAVRVTTDDAEHVAVYAPTAHAALT